MPVVPMKEIVDRAFSGRYGVAAINIVNDLTLQAVLDAATELQSPLIVQTSVKTVKTIGADVLYAMWRSMADQVPVPVTLHLDHCPSREVISMCLEKGWNSVLFDAHELPVEENKRQTTEVVAEARRHGANVEGEIEGIQGIEDDIGSDEASEQQSLDVAVNFIKTTGVDCFAPAIGNAHGTYAAEPKLDSQRVTDLVEATGVPMALHGGTGMSQAQFSDLISRGCPKVNISTALKVAYMQSNLAYLEKAREQDKWDPPSLFTYTHGAVKQMAVNHIRMFGSEGEGIVTALVFDCDGVLADTERDGHRPAFNRTFEDAGLPVTWSVEDYAEKLLIGGGKERMASLFTPEFVAANHLPSDPEGQKARLAQWHKVKTAHFKQMVVDGAMPGRPGIKRIIADALAAGWTVAVASTSAEESVRAVLDQAAGKVSSDQIRVFAGDVVPAKKPDPAIYELVVKEFGLDRDQTLVVEDSRNGLRAAAGAGLRCLITVSSYTRDEDFSEAVLVVSDLGDPGAPPIEVLVNRSRAKPGDYLTLADLEACLET